MPEERGNGPVKLLVVLGAGASYDSSLTDDSHGLTPPLTKHLFASRFDERIRLFPGADTLRWTITSRVSQGFTLEKVLAELNAQPHDEIRRQMKAVTPYLRDIIALASAFGGYRPTVYDSLIHAFQERAIDVFFATLNYDTVLEDAIRRKYARSGYIGTLGDYVQPGREWQLAKLHGSVNWAHRTSINLRESNRLLEHDWSGDYETDVPEYMNALGGDWELGTLLLCEYARQLEKDGVILYPALALPSEQKYEFVCPPDHVASLQQFVAYADAMLVIGNRGMDEDLLDLLENRPPAARPMALRVVDPEEPEVIAGRFASALGGASFTTSKSGFRDFVEGGDADRFLDSIT